MRWHHLSESIIISGREADTVDPSASGQRPRGQSLVLVSERTRRRPPGRPRSLALSVPPCGEGASFDRHQHSPLHYWRCLSASPSASSLSLGPYDMPSYV